MTFKKSLFGGTCLAIQPLLLNVLSLPVMAYIIRGLGPIAFGQWTMATAMIGALGILTSLGLRGAFVRRVAADTRNAPEALAEQLGLRIALAIASAATVFLLCAILRYPLVVTECAAVGALAMIVTTVATTLIDLLQALGRIASIAAVNMLAGLLLTASSILVIWRGMGPVALSAAYLIGPVVSMTALLILVRRNIPVRICFSRRRWLRLLRDSRGFTAQVLLNSASSYTDALLLPRLVGVANFGFYTVGTLLPLRLMAIPDGLCTAAYPMLTRGFRECRAGATRLTFRWLGIILIACLILTIAMFALAGPLASVLFPAQPQSCRMVIQITIWALPLFGIETALGYAINAASADAALARATLPATLCNLILTVLLMTQFGIIGACIAIPLRSGVRIILLTTCFCRWMWPASENPPIVAAAV